MNNMLSNGVPGNSYIQHTELKNYILTWQSGLYKLQIFK